MNLSRHRQADGTAENNINKPPSKPPSKFSGKFLEKIPWVKVILVVYVVAIIVNDISLIAGKDLWTIPGGQLAIASFLGYLLVRLVQGKTELDSLAIAAAFSTAIMVIYFFVHIGSPEASYAHYVAKKAKAKQAVTQQRQIKSVDDLNFSTVEVGAGWTEIARINGECEFYYRSTQTFIIKDEAGNIFYYNKCEPKEVRSFRFVNTQPGTIIYVAKPEKAPDFSLQYQII